MIPISVGGPAGSLQLFGLLDSGSDTTVLPRFVAERIGVEFEPVAGIHRGVGDQTVTVEYATVNLTLASETESYDWQARVGFIEKRTMAILGQAGFLEYFDCTFLGLDHEVVLERNASVLPPIG